MKTLPVVIPTPEQLTIMNTINLSSIVIRGSAGSGKTTTALLRLKMLIEFFKARNKRLAIEHTTRIFVSTFNLTLKGYIEALAQEQINSNERINLTINTFASWAASLAGTCDIVDSETRKRVLARLASGMKLDDKFLTDEIDYIMGRFSVDTLSEYIDCKREGRGVVPRVDKTIRMKLINDVILPYEAWKKEYFKCDWNDLANAALALSPQNSFDVLIVDEAQDLSVNQLRALVRHANSDASLTFVLDAAQRIYPRGMSSWKDVGLDAKSTRYFRLKDNHRNTVQICAFAYPVIHGMQVEDDGTLPDFSSCTTQGPMPKVIVGKYNEQLDYAIGYLRNNIDLTQESVAFLKPNGRTLFNTLSARLKAEGLEFANITRNSSWPGENVNIALSTMYSAKGLEFDHVFIIGLSAFVTPHGDDPDDTEWQNLRRLLAMSITRARKSVVVGYKGGEESRLVGLFDETTFERIIL